MIVTIDGRPVTIGPRAAARSVRAELASQSWALRVWLLFTMALMGLGAYGAIASIMPGKTVFGTSPPVEWGLLIAAYVFFATATSGLCLASSLGTVFGIPRFLPLERRHAILALLCLVTAFGVIALDLHYPIRLLFGAVLSPSPYSPMWWMGVLYGTYLAFLLVEVWSMFTGRARVHRVACTLSSCMAVAAPSTLGAVFGVMATRPFWHGAFTPASFLTFALLAGVSLLGIVFYAVHRFGMKGARDATELAIPSIRLLLTIVLGGVVFLTIWQTIVGLYGGVPGLSEATRALVVGPLWYVFWIFKVGLGIVAPLVMLTLRRTRTPAGLFAASAMALVGAFADRFGFVVGGQLTPDTAASGIVSQPYAQYAPSVVEICVVLGAFGVLAFAYTLAERFLDLGHIDPGAHRQPAEAPAGRGLHGTPPGLPSSMALAEPGLLSAVEPTIATPAAHAEPGVPSAVEPAVEVEPPAAGDATPAEERLAVSAGGPDREDGTPASDAGTPDQADGAPDQPDWAPDQPDGVPSLGRSTGADD